MKADNIFGTPRTLTPAEWRFIHGMGDALRRSFSNVSAVFSPACIGHTAISDPNWVHVQIDDVSLPDAIECWSKSLAGGVSTPAFTELEVRAQVTEEYLRDREDNDVLMPFEIPR